MVTPLHLLCCLQERMFNTESFRVASRHFNLVAFAVDVGLLLKVLKSAVTNAPDTLDVKLTQCSVAVPGCDEAENKPFLCFTARVSSSSSSTSSSTLDCLAGRWGVCHWFPVSAGSDCLLPGQRRQLCFASITAATPENHSARILGGGVQHLCTSHRYVPPSPAALYYQTPSALLCRVMA
jgi:hypothetical protein